MTDAVTNASTRPAGLRRLSAAVLLGGGVAWLALTGVGAEAWPSWIVGLPCVALAAWLTPPPASGAPVGVLAGLRFAAALLAEIFVSAAVVARMVLRPRMDVAPGVVRYPLKLRDPGAQAVFMNAVTLTPGTLSAALEPDGTLRVHALDVREDVAAALRGLERRVARLHGLDDGAIGGERRP